jgi:toxin secretion/phage lysis holin
MENLNKAKTLIISIFGIIGSVAAHYLGGWDMALQTLVIFMAIDYFTGLIVAGVFHKSEKSDSGALESRAGWKGLCRKGMTLLIVLVATQLDKITGTEVIRDAAIIAYVVNETISIIENAGLMGLPIPNIIRKALDLLSKQAEESEVK